MFTDENDDDMMLLGSPCVTPGRPTRALAASCTSTTMAFGLSCPTPPDDGMSPLGTDDTSPYKEPLPRLLVRPATRDTSAPPLRERGNNRHEMIEQFRQQRMRSIGGSFGSLPSPTVALPSTLQDEYSLADEDSRVPSRRHPLVAKRTKTHLGQQAQQVAPMRSGRTLTYSQPGDALQQSPDDSRRVQEIKESYQSPIPVDGTEDQRRIEPHVLLDGEYSSFFSRVFVIDCRFDYEYQGGHIKDALHQDTDAQVLDFFFREQKPLFDQRTAIVFHCEFSSKRGPSRMKALRAYDRALNLDSWPTLHFPHIFLLEGGYKRFFETNAQYCFPQCYVTMKDKTFAADLRRNKGTQNLLKQNLRKQRVHRSNSCVVFGSSNSSAVSPRSAFQNDLSLRTQSDASIEYVRSSLAMSTSSTSLFSTSPSTASHSLSASPSFSRLPPLAIGTGTPPAADSDSPPLLTRGGAHRTFSPSMLSIAVTPSADRAASRETSPTTRTPNTLTSSNNNNSPASNWQHRSMSDLWTIKDITRSYPPS